jgi:hypothetical protein
LAAVRVISRPRTAAQGGNWALAAYLSACIEKREYMRTRWSHVIFDDPFFNPNLSLSGKRGRLATAPRSRIFGKG